MRTASASSGTARRFIQSALVTGLLLTVVALHAGCRGTSLEDACASYGQAVCNLFSRCNPAQLSLVYGNNDVCVERTAMGCTYQFPENSTTEPDTVVTCANALGNASCELGLGIPECR